MRDSQRAPSGARWRFWAGSAPQPGFPLMSGIEAATLSVGERRCHVRFAIPASASPRFATVIPFTSSISVAFTSVCLACELQKPLTADSGVCQVTLR